MEVSILPLPPKEALDYFRAKGLAPADDRFDYRDVWRGQHAASFVVAKAMRDDVLELIRADLDNALAEGRTLDQFRADLAPKLKRAGWWGRSALPDPKAPAPAQPQEVQLGSMHRLRVIFDTNMRTAQAAGRWARIWRTRNAFPYLRYRQIDRPTKRPDHARFDGGCWRVDDPIWARIFPPNGWFCACSVEQITQGQIDRGEVSLSPPLDLDEIEIENERHGAYDAVPNGVTPGFDVNPGMIRQQMDDALAHTGLETHQELASFAAYLSEQMRREDLERAVVIQPGRPIRERYKGHRTGVQIPISDPGSDIMHSHPDYPALSTGDLKMMFLREYRSVFGVTAEGEIFGAIKNEYSQNELELQFLRFGKKWVLPENQWDLRDASKWETMTLLGHALSQWLERSGVLTYIPPRSARMSELTDRFSGLLATLKRVQR